MVIARCNLHKKTDLHPNNCNEDNVMFPKFEHFFDPESLFHAPTCMNFKNMNLYLSSHLFECRYASEWDPREPGHTKVSQAILVLNSKKERTYNSNQISGNHFRILNYKCCEVRKLSSNKIFLIAIYSTDR